MENMRGKGILRLNSRFFHLKKGRACGNMFYENVFQGGFYGKLFYCACHRRRYASLRLPRLSYG
jgi:hypothetical protein